MLQAVVSLAAMAMMINLSMASNYTVGAPNGGWDQSTDLTTWASSQTFLVGDNLIFQYTTNHDVTEVSKPDFDSCSASNPLQPPHSGGLTLIPLTSAGTRYFICGSAGHCLGGMKVQIDILAASSPPPSTTPSLPPPPPPATPPPSITPSIPPPPPATPPTAPPPPSTTPSVPTPSPRTAPSSPSPPPTPSVGRPVSSPPPKSIAPAPSPKHSHGPAPAPSPYHPHSPAPKVSPSSAPPTAAASNPALPPSAAAPSPIGSLPPPPAPSSAAKFTVKGALTAASSGFLMMMFLNL
ncbi:UNVERIFIED_CONTAM: Uclacyanin 1 [Sesamum radiatum]|uniref:Uclacyanin 1 n=1 Tax=Sesamum radiatum TaxID=300843 RepID=A0AAW2T4Q2_SESRA